LCHQLEARDAPKLIIEGLTREAIPEAATAAQKLIDEAKAPATERGFTMPDQTGVTEPNLDESTRKGRKRGPKPDRESPTRVAEIVARVAPRGDWRSKVDDICEALDEAKVPFPTRWRKRPCNAWADYDDRANAIKAIEYRLGIAKQREKAAPETLS
jgi:hypothetical protein